MVGSGVTYDYDAFGNLIHSTGTTANNYLFAGEQFDSDLNLYYNRARYLNVSTGRFWSMDAFDGLQFEPLSLHKYLYARSDPINRIDPSGRQDLISEEEGEAEDEIISSEDDEVENAAKEQVEKELAPETLVHVTSAANARNINVSGLSVLQYPGVVTPSSGMPGAFYAIGFSTPIPYPLEQVIQFAASFVVNTRFGQDTELAGMVGSLPGPVFQGLKASGAIIQGQLGVFQELACLPESFPAIDEYNQGRWVIIPLI